MNTVAAQPATQTLPSDVVDYNLPEPNVAGQPLWMLPTLSRSDARIVTEMWRRGRAGRHLTDYAAFALDVAPALHHRLICDALTDMLLNDTCDVIVINTPPGAAKSTYTSHALCSFALGINPRQNVILATHTAELSEKWSRKVRNTIASEPHRQVFPQSTLSRDSTAVSRWATSEGGEFLAAGVGGSILGFRADLCLTENALVLTRTGYNSISNVKAGDEVLGYDESQLSTGYYRVVAVAERRTDVIYRIHTADGRVVEATGNHPFYSDGCFVPADTLAVGDTLLSSVRVDENNPCIGNGEDARSVTVGAGVLQQVMFEQAQPAAIDTPLRCVQRAVPPAQEDNYVLLSRLLGVAQKIAGAVLRVFRMREPVLSTQQQVEILLDALQERGSRCGDAGTKQSELAGREEPEPLPKRKRTTVSGSAQDSDVSGQFGVRSLLQHGEAARSSCGRRLDEQHGGERGDAVPVVSREATRRGAGETFETTVARVEVVRADTRVWDIQVEGVANFFANDILVHNCVIDDPVNGFEMAQSITQLEKVHGWYETDLVTRLKPRAKQVIICQRLSPNDLAGYLLKRNENNPAVRQRVMIFRMETEDGDEPDGTGRSPGDRLWPEWFNEQMVEDARRDDFKWRTLYQQKPPSDTGSWVMPDEIGYVDDVPENVSHYMASDLALSVNTGDYSVHLVCAVDDQHNLYVEHAWRARVSVDVTADKHLDLVAEYKPLECLIDDDNASRVYVQLLATRGRERGVPCPYKPMKLQGQDKETRAAPLRGWFKRGKVFLKRADWNGWLVKEILTFPNAMGSGVDDGVDSLSLMGRRLASLARPAGAAPPPVPQKTIQQATLDELWADKEARNRFNQRRI